MTSHSQTQCLEHQTWLFPHKSATEQNLLAGQVLVYGGAVVTWHPLPQLGLGELRQFSLMLTTSAGGWGGLGSADELLLFCGFLPCSEPQEQENSHVPSNTGFQDASSKCSIGQGKSQTSSLSRLEETDSASCETEIRLQGWRSVWSPCRKSYHRNHKYVQSPRSWFCLLL